jgi:hypothetical protein
MTDNVSRVQNTMIRELVSNEMVISDSLGKKEEEDRDEEEMRSKDHKPHQTFKLFYPVYPNQRRKTTSATLPQL